MISIDLSEYHFDALIFDCDGTLVNSAPLHFESFRLALSEHDMVLAREWYDNRLGLSRLDLLTEFKTANRAEFNIDQLVTATESHYLKLVNDVEPIPETIEIVNRFYGELPMAVASSGQRSSVVSSLQAVGIFQLFDCLISADDVVRCKPYPDVYFEAAKRLDVTPSKCLVFEDTDEGISAATSAGANVLDVRGHVSIY